MHSIQMKQFLREYAYLFWHTPAHKKENISDELLVEIILNYGDFSAIRKLFAILGRQKIAEIFYRAEGRKKLNYYPEIYNFFNLYFGKYAHRNS